MAAGEGGNGAAEHRRRRGVSLATRLAGAIVIVSLAALSAATLVGINAGLSLGREIYEDRLVSLNNSSSSGIAAAFASSNAAAEALALSPSTADATVAFAAAIGDVSASAEFDPNSERRELVKAYETVYGDVLAATADDLSIQSLVARTADAIYLQTRYSINPEIRRAAIIDDAEDGSSWSEVHAEYNPGFRRFVDELELSDLYLVEPVNEQIVYSVEKRLDLGTSLQSGPFSGSVLANTVSRVFEDPGAGSVISDLSFYDAIPGEPVGAYAAPILADGELVGVLAFLYDGAVLTDIVSNDGDWEAAGYDDTADVYFVGDDGTMRTDPRGFLDDPAAFLDASQAAAGLTNDERAVIEARGTTVLVLRAVDATISDHESDDDPVAERTSIDGKDVFSSVAVFDTPNSDLGDQLDWLVVAEIEVEEAETSIEDFRGLLVVGTAVFMIVAAFMAVAWANRLMAPVRAISDRLGDPDTTAPPLELSESSPLEFQYLAASFEQMATILRQQHGQLATAREGRLELMQRMLPPAVAERVAAGDLDGLDEVAQTSVAVVVVLGLAELVQQEGSEGRAIVEALHEELDALAEQHGLDRIKVVGDAYFASCGHDRPYIDHAPRAVTFATDARDAVEEFGRRTQGGLDAAIGVHTGSVTIGMVGEQRMIFDVWGDTVSHAHLLARRAGHNSILLSDSTHQMLPDELVTEPFEATGEGATWAVPLTTVGGIG